MNFGRALNRYLDALTNARAALSTPGVLLPFVYFALLQVAILLAMASFTAPALSPVMVPAMRALGGEESLHYPLHLVGLPSVYQRVYLPLAATIGFSLWTLAVWKLVDHHEVGADRPRRKFRPVLGRVIILGVLFVGASVAVGELSSRLTGPRTPELIARAVLIGSIVLTATAQAFLIYAPVALRLRGGSVWSAIGVGASYARRHFLATALLLLTVLLVHLPVDFLLSRADRIAARFHPEAVLHLMIGSVVLEIFTAYLLFAGITALALPREGGLR
jgi:hypothetical protein